jgi:hypothetical protein
VTKPMEVVPLVGNRPAWVMPPMLDEDEMDWPYSYH